MGYRWERSITLESPGCDIYRTFLGRGGRMFGNLCQKLPETKRKNTFFCHNLCIFQTFFFLPDFCFEPLWDPKLSPRLQQRRSVFESLAIKHAQTQDVGQEDGALVGVAVWPRLRCGPVSDGRCRKSVGMETDLSSPHYSHTPQSKKKTHAQHLV